MSYRHTMEAAMESLHEIEDLVREFPGDGKIPVVEIDLALQKLRNVYELLLMFRKPPEALTEKEVAGASSALAGEVAIPKAAIEKITDEASVVTSTGAPPVHKESRTVRDVQTLSDQFKVTTTLHDSLHHSFANEGETLAHAKPVTDLLSAIGLNDRFTFIRELFNGDTAIFENTIKELNNAASFNDAYNYMIQHFEWDMDSIAVQQLLDIIRRKFIKGRHE